MRNLLVCFSLLMLGSCAAFKSTELKESVDIYKAKASEVVKAAKKPETHAKTMEKLGNELLSLARPILNGFQKRHPSCTPFLEYVLQNANYMTTLTVEKIETDFHDGEALPKSPEKCYEAKELVVHPATVVVLARKKYDREGRQQMADEIEEVLAHIEDLQ